MRSFGNPLGHNMHQSLHVLALLFAIFVSVAQRRTAAPRAQPLTPMQSSQSCGGDAEPCCWQSSCTHSSSVKALAWISASLRCMVSPSPISAHPSHQGGFLSVSMGTLLPWSAPKEGKRNTYMGAPLHHPFCSPPCPPGNPTTNKPQWPVGAAQKHILEIAAWLFGDTFGLSSILNKQGLISTSKPAQNSLRCGRGP